MHSSCGDVDSDFTQSYPKLGGEDLFDVEEMGYQRFMEGLN
jgi:hypothetical protein